MRDTDAYVWSPRIFHQLNLAERADKCCPIASDYSLTDNAVRPVPDSRTIVLSPLLTTPSRIHVGAEIATIGELARAAAGLRGVARINQSVAIGVAQERAH